MSKESKKICVFGDSVAYGYSDIGNCGWVDRIKVALNYRDFTQVFNLGISGDTTEEVLKRFDYEIAARRHHIIVFALGLNDSKNMEDEGRLLVPLEKYRENMEALIKKAKKLAEAVILVGFNPVDEALMSPVSWNSKESFDNKRIEDYNKALGSIAKKEGIDFVDIHKKFIEEDYKKLLHDGLHPNTRGHELIFNEVKDLLWKKHL